MIQQLTVNLPGDLYARIKSRADVAHRSVEQETVALLEGMITNAVPAVELQGAVAELDVLDNAAIEKIARSRLADDLVAELEALHFKQQREGITAVEKSRCTELVTAYERSMLMRAQAVALLNRRGIDVATLIAPQ